MQALFLLPVSSFLDWQAFSALCEPPSVTESVNTTEAALSCTDSAGKTCSALDSFRPRPRSGQFRAKTCGEVGFRRETISPTNPDRGADQAPPPSVGSACYALCEP